MDELIPFKNFGARWEAQKEAAKQLEAWKQNLSPLERAEHNYKTAKQKLKAVVLADLWWGIIWCSSLPWGTYFAALGLGAIVLFVVVRIIYCTLQVLDYRDIWERQRSLSRD